jgi:hypothetical protein
MATNMPNNPAPVSGPGALSKRTDGGPGDEQPIRDVPGGNYGDRKEMQQIQQGAPMYAQPAPTGGPMPQATPPPPGGLFDPTARPSEPITSGIASGPGAGLSDDSSRLNDDMELIATYLPDLRRVADSPTATQSFKAAVRYLEQFNG